MDYQSFLKKHQKKEVIIKQDIAEQHPVVSVCVQTYLHANYIKQCLDGILMQQTTFPIEILLGEDASNDGTREICLEYAAKHPDKIRLFLHHRENNIAINGTPTGRFNFLYNLYNARGKYIAICEGDDYWTDPLKLQKQVDFLEENDGYSGCFHLSYISNHNKSDDNILWRTYNKLDFDMQDTLSKTALFHTSSFLFKASYLNIPTWFNQVQSGDMALFALIANNGKLRLIDEVMSVYRKNQGGITTTISELDYHNNRIKLFQFFNDEFDARYHDKINAVITFHRNALQKNKKSNKLSIFQKILKLIRG